MARRSLTSLLVLLSLLVSSLAPMAASAEVLPPWCGDPVPDAAANLPDGTEARTIRSGASRTSRTTRSGCTLEEIVAQQRRPDDARGDRQVRAAAGTCFLRHGQRARHGPAAPGLPGRGSRSARSRSTDPARGQALLASYGDEVKVPIFVQGAIHGNEYEGVEAIFETLEKLATTPYGTDPEVDAVLDHAIVLFNVIQNPDGRVAGTRANGNGFDMNRDFMTQSQSETRAARSSAHAEVAPGRGPRPARLRDADPDRGRRRSRTTRASTTTSGSSGTSRDSTPTRPRSPPSGSTSPARSTTGAPTAARRRPAGSARTASRPARPRPRAGTTGARSTRRCTPSTSASTARRSRCATRPTRELRPARRHAPTSAAGSAPAWPRRSSSGRPCSSTSRTGTRCSTTSSSATGAA